MDLMFGSWRTALVLTLVLIGCENALGRVKVDSVLLLDTSASMLTTDPANRRIAAIRMFISLLGDEDRISLILFDNTTRLLSDLQLLQAPEKEKWDQLIAGLGRPNGPFTNLHEPVDKALELLMKERRPDALPLVILLTDGKMDVGNVLEDKRLIDDLRETVIPRYQRDRVRLFCLAFGDYNLSFLQDLSNRTGGKTWTTQKAQNLKSLFDNLFVTIKNPQILPVSSDAGRFRVETDTRELMVFTNDPDGQDISLKSPGGKQYSKNGGDIIRVKEPEAGNWFLKGPQNAAKVYAEPDLNMEVRLPASFIEAVDPPPRIEAWLNREEKPVRDTAILEGMRFWLAILSLDANGQSPVNLDLNDKGISDDLTAGDGLFSIRIPPLKTGYYQVDVHADKGALKLTQNLLLEVKSKPAESASASKPLPNSPSNPDSSSALSNDVKEINQATKTFLAVNLILILCVGSYFLLRGWRKKDSSCKEREGTKP